MDRIIIIVLAIVLGGIGGGFVVNFFDEDDIVETSAWANIQEPKAVTKVEVLEVYSQNTAVGIKENTTLGFENNAAMLKQWNSVASIGVDFTGFDWKTLSGIGETLPESGDITISGTLPPIEVLHNYAVNGEEVDKVISRIKSYNEEASLLPLLEQQKVALMDCVVDQAFYRQKTIDTARERIVSLISAAVPPRQDGTVPVKFSLEFANEPEILTMIAQRTGQSANCENTVTVK